MTAQRASVRSGRRAPVVVVTAAASAAGRAIVDHLEEGLGRPDGPGAVVAVGAVAPAPRDLQRVTWREADCAAPAVAAALAGADVVVHVAAPTDMAAELAMTPTARRARVVRAVQEVAVGAAAAGAGRLIVVTSAMVYGAGGGRPVPLPEDFPLRADRDEGVVGDLLEVERIVARLPRVHPGLRTTVLRPAALVGPGVDTLVTRHFASPRLLALRGETMLWQFCHVDDLAAAVGIALAAELDGVLTVGCLPWLTAGEVERLAGMRRVELPATIAYATAQRLRRAGVVSAPPGELDYVVHPWVVDGRRLRDAGWRPRYDGAACVAALTAARRGAVGPARTVERREAAIGAAGAAVAIIGTAALLRQARGRRRGGRRPRL